MAISMPESVKMVAVIDAGEIDDEILENAFAAQYIERPDRYIQWFLSWTETPAEDALSAKLIELGAPARSKYSFVLIDRG